MNFSYCNVQRICLVFISRHDNDFEYLSTTRSYGKRVRQTWVVDITNTSKENSLRTLHTGENIEKIWACISQLWDNGNDIQEVI